MMGPMEIFSFVIIHFGMKTCSKEMQLTGIDKISLKDMYCVGTGAQEYETSFVKDIFGNVKEIKMPKYCTTQIVCHKGNK